MSRYNIAVWGDGAPVLTILPILKDNGIIVEYVKQDKQHTYSDSFIKAVNDLGYPCYIDDYPDIDVDLILTINYNRIITEAQLSQYNFMNYHVGLLPKWRGNSANGWAIINGENEVGYTLHKVVSMLDDGPIYYRFKYPYIEGKTYVDAKTAMEADLKANISDIIKRVIVNPNAYINEALIDYVYCSKFRPIDGMMSSWNVTTEEIIRKLYVFGPPLGTGLKFIFKNRIYEIRGVSRIPLFAQSKGIPGGIIYMSNGSLWVKTLDTAISIDDLYCEGNKVNPHEHFIIGQRIM